MLPFAPAVAVMVKVLVAKLAPINERFIELRQDRAALDAILRKGAEKARTLAMPTLNATYDALGLGRG